MWRVEQTLWAYYVPIVLGQKGKRQKFEKNVRRISGWHFQITFCFKCEIFFQLTPEILKFQFCF